MEISASWKTYYLFFIYFFSFTAEGAGANERYGAALVRWGELCPSWACAIESSRAVRIFRFFESFFLKKEQKYLKTIPAVDMFSKTS